MTEAIPEGVPLTDEQPVRTLSGRMAWIVALLAGGLATMSLYWTQYSIDTISYRASFLAFVLVLSFLLYPATTSAKGSDRVALIDWLLAAISVAALAYLILHVEDVKTRATRPLEVELWLGTGLILCILEATRRTTGWPLPFITLLFIGYAFAGP